MAEGDTFAIGALVRKRAELAGLVERHRAELDAMVANLGHLDATLRLVDPEIRLDAIRPKAPRPVADPGRPEITTRMVLDALRCPGEPLGAREIATRLLAEMGVAADACDAPRTVARLRRPPPGSSAIPTAACTFGRPGIGERVEVEV